VAVRGRLVLTVIHSSAVPRWFPECDRAAPTVQVAQSDRHSAGGRLTGRPSVRKTDGLRTQFVGPLGTRVRRPDTFAERPTARDLLIQRSVTDRECSLLDEGQQCCGRRRLDRECSRGGRCGR
jgi:hypothetical protein